MEPVVVRTGWQIIIVQPEGSEQEGERIGETVRCGKMRQECV
jgi:hypothetical protein